MLCHCYQIFDALEQLHKDLARLLLGQFLLHDDVVEQFPFRRQLQHDVDAVIFIETIFEAQHVRMADRLQHADLLLQSFRPGSIVPRALLEFLDGELHAGASFHAEMDRGKMPFAELMENAVLLPKRIPLPVAWVVEHEASLIQHGNLIRMVEFAALVSSHDGLVDKGAIGRQIFQDGDALPVLVLVEDDAMTIGDGGQCQHPICPLVSISSMEHLPLEQHLTALGMPPDQVTSRRKAQGALVRFVVQFLLHVTLPRADPLRSFRGPSTETTFGEGGGTGHPFPHDQRVAKHAIDGDQVSPHPFGLLILHLVG